MEYMALGCMSGTSLDGIDCSLIKSDGLSFANEISNEFIPYSKELQKKLLNTISQEYLNDPSVLTLLNEEYKKAINQFIKNNNVKIDLIAMHGQTIFHDQKTKISIQLFDKSLSFDSNSPVICNFRKNDLLNGGNGAPIMPEFHNVDWDKKLSVLSKFKDERLQYFGKKLLYMEKPEMLSKTEYNIIHKDTAKKLLSTNNEKWNTIPRTYSEIDTLRNKFKDDKEKLKALDDINLYIEEMEKMYQKAY